MKSTVFKTSENNPRVRTEIVEFQTDKPKRGRRGSPAIPEGTTLYAIKYLHSKGGYSTYSYLHRKDAENAIEMSRIQQTDNERYYEWNVTYDIQNTLHYGDK